MIDKIAGRGILLIIRINVRDPNFWEHAVNLTIGAAQTETERG